MKILFGICIALLCAGPAVSQECAVDSGFRGGRFSIYYEQRHLVKHFKNLNELPSNVRTRLDEYLQRKLGPAFAKRLKFDGGIGLIYRDSVWSSRRFTRKIRG